MHKISGAGIGYGGRSDFTRTLAVSPACNQYQFLSEF